MSTYLLIHGAWHGRWCWKKVTPLLERAGHTVIAPDLPGAGLDLTPLAAVTFASAVERLIDVIDAQPGGEPLIIVAHGLAGMILSQVAEARAERINLLVYLSALLPKSGETALHLLAQEDHTDLEACVEVDDLSVRVIPDKAHDIFYQDCEQQVASDALLRLTSQASALLFTPVTLTERFLGVPRVYLTCRYDRVISPHLQAQMYGATPCERVIWLMTGHAPFLSTPDRLAARLIGLARFAGNREEPHHA